MSVQLVRCERVFYRHAPAVAAVTERTKSAGDVRGRIEGRRRELVAAMEPNFGLTEQLVSWRALSVDEREDVRAAKTRSKRCRKLLKFILARRTPDNDDDDARCRLLLHALDKTEQRHVVNFVLQDAGMYAPRGVATGWTGMATSIPLFSRRGFWD